MLKFLDLGQRKVGEKGFTLVELILVMAIVGILAGLAVPRFTGVLERAKEKADEANKKIIREAAELWYMQTGQTGKIPENGNAVPLSNDTFFRAEGQTGEKLVPDFLKEIPENPMDTGEYRLKIDEGGKAIVTHAKDTAKD